MLTIGSIHGGSAGNIIPACVELQGTLRVFDATLREHLLGRIRDLVEGLGSVFRVETTLHLNESCPATVNDPEMADFVRRVAGGVLGPGRVQQRTRTTGAEDMSLFLNAVPGCYFFVGSGNPERGLASPHHSPTFDFDEQALDVGVEVLAATALEFLAAAESP